MDVEIDMKAVFAVMKIRSRTSPGFHMMPFFGISILVMIPI